MFLSLSSMHFALSLCTLATVQSGQELNVCVCNSSITDGLEKYLMTFNEALPLFQILPRHLSRYL